MKIIKVPLTDSYFITLFEGREVDYSISNSLSGYIIFNKRYIATEFQSKKYNYSDCKMFGKISDLTEDKALNILQSAGLTAPYIDYVDREKTYDSALLSFMSFLESEKWDIPHSKTWLIIPKPSKKLNGKKIIMEFNVGALDFSNADGVKMDLEVFMTPITKTSKSVSFSMRVPKFLYDKCMTDAIVENRPKQDFIQGDTLSILHNGISNLVSQANGIWSRDKSASEAVKVIGINFYSNEKSMRDEFNFGFTGQEISTKFNFFVAYKTNRTFGNGFELFTYKKLQSGMGTTENGVKGIIDTELLGKRNWVRSNPMVLIDWTQEREDFLTKLEEKFRALSENLNGFLKDLNDEKFELLMQNAEFLKLN